MRIDNSNKMSTAQAVTTLMNGGIQSDSYTKNIQSQITNAQQKLQDLSSNEELSMDDKMKKRQEIQQEITNLNQQLRQHQIEQRKEQQSKKASSMDNITVGARRTASKKNTGLSQESMQAMISADASMKQASVQGSVTSSLKGRAGVLESEIKQDAGKGNTEKKEQELADVQEKAQQTTASQISTLADANKIMKEAAKADTNASGNADDNTVGKKDKTDRKDNSADKSHGRSDNNTDNNIKNADDVDLATENVKTDGSDIAGACVGEIAQNMVGQIVYKSIDIRL